MITDLPVQQIAYVVPDIRKAAAQHAELFGSGPFFVAKNISFSESVYRGRSVPFRHSAAFGQWGSIQLELMQREDDQPSVLTDVLSITSGRPTTHHKAIFVEDPRATALAFERAGFATAWRGVMTAGIEVFMIDTLALYGHMVELYAPSDKVLAFYKMVKDASIGFQGTDVVRDFSFD